MSEYKSKSKEDLKMEAEIAELSSDELARYIDCHKKKIVEILSNPEYSRDQVTSLIRQPRKRALTAAKRLYIDAPEKISLLLKELNKMGVRYYTKEEALELDIPLGRDERVEYSWPSCVALRLGYRGGKNRN